jgi:hypothetical protein
MRSQILNQIRYSMHKVLPPLTFPIQQAAFIQAAMITKTQIENLRQLSIDDPKYELDTVIIDMELRDFKNTLNEHFSNLPPNGTPLKPILEILEFDLKNILTWT